MALQDVTGGGLEVCQAISSDKLRYQSSILIYIDTFPHKILTLSETPRSNAVHQTGDRPNSRPYSLSRHNIRQQLTPVTAWSVIGLQLPTYIIYKVLRTDHRG